MEMYMFLVSVIITLIADNVINGLRHCEMEYFFLWVFMSILRILGLLCILFFGLKVVQIFGGMS